MRAALAATLLSLAAGQAAGDVVFDLPIACTPGQDCFIQHLVDRDPGPGVRDFTCGQLSYDGHKGTDFALPSLRAMADGVDVRAAAPGRVRARRDGMADRPLTEATAAAIAGRDCGNGVVIDHAGGWQSQYCHLRQGSVTVETGQQVAAGQVLGQVGLSGRTQFPHLHFTLRRDGAVIDPFAPDMAAECGGAQAPLWRDAPTAPPGGLIAAGFAAELPDYAAVKAGTAARQNLPAGTPALVLFAAAYGGRAGDRLDFVIAGPGGRALLSEQVTLAKPQAQYFRALGRRAGGPGWPAGRYRGRVELWRAGARLDSLETEITLR